MTCPEMKQPNSVLHLLLNEWKLLLVILTPLVLLPLLIVIGDTESKCAYVIVIMSIFFMTQSLPLPVTALIPVFAFPILGVVSTSDICMVYMRGTTMVFLGGLVIALAVEYSQLHRRIALFVILKLGQTPARLMSSFLLTSMFLSIWISNTAAAAMMVPIVDAILQELYKSDLQRRQTQIKRKDSVNIPIGDKHCSPFDKSCDTCHESTNGNDEKKIELAFSESTGKLSPPDDESKALSVMYFLSVVYGCNLGGTSFPTGTGPNLVLWGIVSSSYPGGTGLDFGSWMAFNVPVMIVCVFIVWLWLTINFIGFGPWKKVSEFSKKKQEAIHRVIEKQYDSLGEITFHEKTVVALFTSLVVLWIFRSPEMITGWADIIQTQGINIGSATPAIFILVILFVMPSKLPWNNYSGKPTSACLSWDVVQEKLPWGLLLLVGGGFAMAEGAEKSGLSRWIQFQLQAMKYFSGQTIIILVCLITSVLTELITNITAASILLPVLRDMAVSIGMHPFMLMIPATVCCSYAFMLPVSNPPNAMAFNASGMKMSDMVKSGFVLKFFCILVLIILINTLGVFIFEMDEFPDWAVPKIIEISLINNTVANSNTTMLYTQ